MSHSGVSLEEEMGYVPLVKSVWFSSNGVGRELRIHLSGDYDQCALSFCADHSNDSRGCRQ